MAGCVPGTEEGDIDALLRYADTLAREKKVDRDLRVAAFDGRSTRNFEKRFPGFTGVLKAALGIRIWLIEPEVITIDESAIHPYEELGFRTVGVVANKF
jgi:hypothetical protein